MDSNNICAGPSRNRDHHSGQDLPAVPVLEGGMEAQCRWYRSGYVSALDIGLYDCSLRVYGLFPQGLGYALLSFAGLRTGTTGGTPPS